jgi:DNA-binding MarR family transcriptional regulator
MSGPSRPIGYWLKRADQLLTDRIDAAQRATGLTRLEWQLLNVIRKTTPTVEKAAEALRPFADPTTADAAIASLEARRALRRTAAGVALTAEGDALFVKALAVQTSVRERAMAGIAGDEYETTMRVLQRLVENLERDAPDPSPVETDGPQGR